jgi:hypothetical protein
MGSLSGAEFAAIVAGASLMGYAVAGLFFLRFWKDTGDRFFAIFAASFWLLGIQRLLVSLTPQDYENLTYLYLLRLIAYALILGAILDKNRKRDGGTGGRRDGGKQVSR